MAEATATAASNYERVTQGLRIVQSALAPFVYRELCGRHGGKWWSEGILPNVSEMRARELPASGNGKELIDRLDVSDLLRIVNRRWDVFGPKLHRDDRNYVNEMASIRNAWAHAGGRDMTEDDAWRALDTASRLLEHVQPGAARETQALARAVRAAVYREPPAPAPAIKAPPAPSAQQRVRGDDSPRGAKGDEDSRSSAAGTGAGKGRASTGDASRQREGQVKAPLRPWREVITPHEDVAGGRYQEAEFAADLSEVLRGTASPEYGDASEFFARTYLTEGMAFLLTSALQRLAGTGGQPVVQLKTAFGGGKTHTMLALYHLVRDKGKTGKLDGIRGVLDRAGLREPLQANVAVLVGTALDATAPQLDAGGNGIEVRTLWGNMAAQLGQREGYELVRAADEGGVAPGADTLVRLFDRFGPCLILVDELVAYARNIYGVSGLPAGTFDAVMTFMQALTEAAKRAGRTMVVASLPESNAEVGGAAGQEALERLEKVIGRVEAVWKPVGALEGFEIVRRRLFGAVRDEDAKEASCLSYARLYGGNATEFPRACGEARYLERLRAAYPIHPEVFDRLYDDWATLERFQRTRGVLRLMAAAIHALWVRGDRSLLIQPGTLPLDVPRIKDELLRYLPEGWTTVIDRDVDGDRSEPWRIDEENARLGEMMAAKRVARAIFLGSAPHVAQQRVRGIEDVRVRLGVVQPGESIAVFNDALGRLADRLTYLYGGNHRYWYDTHPNLRRTAEDRAGHLDAYEVAREIETRLRRDRDKGGFKGVHPWADQTGSDIPDEQAARLILLRSGYRYSRTRSDATAIAAATRILEGRGNSPRTFRNTLVFVAPDAEAMDGLDLEVRRFLAWRSIVGEEDILNLDTYQRKQAQEGMKRADETVDLRLRESYAWLLVPAQPDGGAWTWEAHRIPGDGSLAERASRKLREAEQLIPRWSPALLRMELDRWLWRDAAHLSVKRLWEYLCTYGYLPRLRDADVLLEAMAEGLRSRDYFGYARSVAPSGRYEGLIFGKPTLASALTLDELSVLVKPDAARAQQRADAEVEDAPLPAETAPSYPVEGAGDTPTTGFGEGHGRYGAAAGSGASAPARPVLRRYYGVAQLNEERVGRDAARIADEVIAHLNALHGAQVKVTIEIEATAPGGVPENVVQIVTENGNTLKFRSQNFEEM